MNFKLALCCAVVLHFLLIALGVFYVKQASNTPHYVSAYVVKAISIQQKIVPQKNLGIQIINQTGSTLLENPSPQDRHSAIPAVNRQLSSQAAGETAQHIQPLILWLHNQIQAALIYPVSATTEIPSGQAQVRFLLHPNGIIEQIQVVKSSGNIALDEAALQAVQSISPVQEAALLPSLLKQAHYFVITLEFDV